MNKSALELAREAAELAKHADNVDFIAHAGTNYATVARAAIEMAKLLEQTRRTHQHDAEEWCNVNDDYPEAFCTCGADAWNARIDALIGEGA